MKKPLNTEREKKTRSFSEKVINQDKNSGAPPCQDKELGCSPSWAKKWSEVVVHTYAREEVYFFLWFRAFQLKQLAEWQRCLMTLNRLSLASSSGLHSSTTPQGHNSSRVCDPETTSLHFMRLHPFLNKSLSPGGAAAQQNHAMTVGNSWGHIESSLLGTFLKYCLKVLLRKSTAAPLVLHRNNCCNSFDWSCSACFKKTRPQHPRRGQKAQLEESDQKAQDWLAGETEV